MNKCYKLLFATALLLTCSLFTASAQQVTISGNVTAGDTGESLPGVSILEKGTTNGAVTDLDGRYSLEASQGATLIYSFVGYIPKEVNLGSQTLINVSLDPDIQQLSEIVVIGYGQVEKDDLTGAVTSVGPDEFNKGAIVNAQDLLAGRVAGLQVTSTGGAPGASSRIRIRGGSSINASNEPLVVIDGMPVANDEFSGMRNPMSIVNPNDIESISVLKDASATAIYGARASNGVIIITTKRGSTDKIQVSYNGSFAMHTVAKKLDVLSGDELRTLVDDRVAGGDAQAVQAQALLGSENTDWQSQVLEDTYGMDHNVSVTGGLAGVPVRVSVGYTDQNGILKTTNFKRTSVSAGVDPSFFDNHLKLNLNFKGMFAENRFADEGRAIGGAVNFDPTQPVRNADGSFFEWTTAGTQGPANPVAALDLVNNTAKVNRYLMNAAIDYKLHFLPDLSAKVNVALDKSTSDGLEIVDPAALWESGSYNGAGKYNKYDQEKTNELIETTLNYRKELPGNGGKLDLLAGYSWQHFRRDQLDSANNLLETPNFAGDINNTKTENFLVSFFGRLNYTILDRYILTFTLRRDGSSRFAEQNRWGLFPSAAIAWQINEEAFLRNSEVVSSLKLRAGYGVTGQQDLPDGNDYPALARVTYSDNFARYPIGGDYINAIRFDGYDANLKWEETTTINLGLDFGFLNDRITGSVDAYYRETVDALSTIPVPLGTNFTNFLLTNIGNVENKGIEASISGYVIDNNDFSWNLGFNVTHNVNKITKLTAVDDPDFIGILTGGIGGGVGNTVQNRSVGNPVDSYFMYQQVYDDNGSPIENLYVDQNGDGVINDSDRVISKNPVPDVYLGFSTRINYKQFDFSLNARANIGNYVYDNVSSGSAVYSNLYQSQGYVNNVGRDVFNTNFENNRFLSDYYLYNASFFRIDNVSVGYKVDRFFSDKLDAYFSFTVQNALVVTDYHGLDPEVQGAKAPGSSDEPVGIDNNIYPRPRSFVLGVNINF